MAVTFPTSKHPAECPPRAKPATRIDFFPWKRLLVASLPIALLAFYVTHVGPEESRRLEGLKVTFPALTRLLGGMCIWCGDNQVIVFAAAGALLAAGLLFKISASRYYLHLTIVASVFLAVTYYSVSAPIERLVKSVEDELPRDTRVPDYNRPK